MCRVRVTREAKLGEWAPNSCAPNHGSHWSHSVTRVADIFCTCNSSPSNVVGRACEAVGGDSRNVQLLKGCNDMFYA